MTYRLKVSQQNQVTLPVDFINKLGLKSGMYLEITQDWESEDIFKIENTRKKISKLQGSLGKKVKDKNKLLNRGLEFEQVLEKSKIANFNHWKV